MATRLAVVMLLVAGVTATAGPADAQATFNASANQCRAVAKPQQPSEEARRQARELVTRAQEAAIVEDNATVRDLYRRAVELDPTDPATAYALARVYETARDPRAIAEYCRFLALSPSSSEAADVRQRVAALSFDLLPRQPVAQNRSGNGASPAAALGLGIVFPGAGQYSTHRPVVGLLVTAATAGALYYGLRTEKVRTSVTRTAVDLNGIPYEYQDVVTKTNRPNIGVGVGTAAFVSLMAAIEAYSRARGVERARGMSASVAERAGGGAPNHSITGTVSILAPAPATGRGAGIGVGAHVELGSLH